MSSPSGRDSPTEATRAPRRSATRGGRHPAEAGALRAHDALELTDVVGVHGRRFAGLAPASILPIRA
jgi:hypothetical protein